MGICNVTPDSFSDGGQHSTFEDAMAHGRKLLADGADIIDVGGESTRPGAAEVPGDVELSRVLDVVRALSDEGVKVSIDTRHAAVARACVEAGACIINDVSGFRTQEMADVAAACDAGLAVMHMRETPETMQDAPTYSDVALEVRDELLDAVGRLEQAGVDGSRICLDYGIGFGKTRAHNQALVDATAAFADLGYPLMCAVSRKSYIGAMTGSAVPSERDRASALCAAFLAGLGARVIRTHDVALCREMLDASRRAVISLGANQGDSVGQLDSAIAALRRHPDIWVGMVSRYCTSEPAYNEDQDDFVNAVAVIQTTLGPFELLDALHGIENDHGRVRVVENGPRTLDLDIVDYQSVVMDELRLKLPHPLAYERGFVVTPLLELMPAFELASGAALSQDDVRVGKVIAPAQPPLRKDLGRP